MVILLAGSKRIGNMLLLTIVCFLHYVLIVYILNAKKDGEFAEVKNVVVGPIDSADFINNWEKKYDNMKFVSVSD
jgi:hypothetical protein